MDAVERAKVIERNSTTFIFEGAIVVDGAKFGQTGVFVCKGTSCLVCNYARVLYVDPAEVVGTPQPVEQSSAVQAFTL